MKTEISFSELSDLLVRIGFRRTDEKTRLRFDHPITTLLFRLYRPEELVSDRDLLVIRRQLVDNGLIEEDALERFLHRVPA